MITFAENFLLKCILSSDVDSFDDRCYQVFFYKNQSQFNIEKLPPKTIKQHILRDYSQCYLLAHSAFTEEIKWDLLMYSYKLDKNEDLQSSVTVGPCITEELPVLYLLVYLQYPK